MQRYDPDADPALPTPFSAEHPDGKVACRAALLNELGLVAPPPGRLLAAIGRLDAQKGWDVIEEAVPALVAHGASLALLGDGDPALAQRLRAACARHPRRVSLHVGWDEPRARRLVRRRRRRADPVALRALRPGAAGGPALRSAAGRASRGRPLRHDRGSRERHPVRAALGRVARRGGRPRGRARSGAHPARAAALAHETRRLVGRAGGALGDAARGRRAPGARARTERSRHAQPSRHARTRSAPPGPARARSSRSTPRRPRASSSACSIPRRPASPRRASICASARRTSGTRCCRTCAPGSSTATASTVPTRPSSGQRCNPHKLLVDPYARAIAGRVELERRAARRPRERARTRSRARPARQRRAACPRRSSSIRPSTGKGTGRRTRRGVARWCTSAPSRE